jgi:hypothetical protein
LQLLIVQEIAHMKMFIQMAASLRHIVPIGRKDIIAGNLRLVKAFRLVGRIFNRVGYTVLDGLLVISAPISLGLVFRYGWFILFHAVRFVDDAQKLVPEIIGGTRQNNNHKNSVIMTNASSGALANALR